MSDQQVVVSQKQIVIILTVLLGIALGVIGLLYLLVNQDQTATSKTSASNAVVEKTKTDFLGDQGQKVMAIDDQIFIDEQEVADGNLHAYHFDSTSTGKTIYFFIVRASDGTYRAAANACEVCFESQKGFTQIGNQIRCENCRTVYTKDQIALQKGGCNPRPIDKDARIENGKLVLDVTDVENSADLF